MLDSNTILGSKGTYNIKSAPTADMISVPSDMHYTSADMAAEIKGKVTLRGMLQSAIRILRWIRVAGY